MENNLELDNLKKDKRNLRKLIILLKVEYNVSLSKIAEELRLNRETIRRIYNE